MTITIQPPRLYAVVAGVAVSIAVLAQKTGVNEGQTKISPPTTDQKVAVLQKQVEQLTADVKTLKQEMSTTTQGLASANQAILAFNRPPQGYSRSFMIKLNWNSLPDNTGLFVYSPSK